MAVWLYQLSSKKEEWDNCTPNDYKKDIWENQDYTWDVGIIRSDEIPKEGDMIILFFAKSSDEPGIYGWGVINSYTEDKKICFTPILPSNYLKNHPLWDIEIEKMMKEIREPIFQGNMWKIY